MDLEQTWRWFHQHAELSFKEYETTKEIRRILSSINGVALLDLGLPTGVLAQIRGDQEGPVILLRADIDALPIREQTALGCPSLTEGTMHACGHDWHIVNLLQTAWLLSRKRKEIHGTILLLFQPAEESGGGAKRVVGTGLFTKYPVKRVFGLHIQPQLEAGTIAVCDGAISAAVDRFSITIHGTGCHGAHPEDGLDPIPAACQLAVSLENIVARRIKASDQAVVSVTHLEAGTSWNIIPDTAHFEGILRTMGFENRDMMVSKIYEVIAQVEKETGVKAEVEMMFAYPGVVNHEGSDMVEVLDRNTLEGEGFRNITLGREGDEGLRMAELHVDGSVVGSISLGVLGGVHDIVRVLVQVPVFNFDCVGRKGCIPFDLVLQVCVRLWHTGDAQEVQFFAAGRPDDGVWCPRFRRGSPLSVAV